MKSNDALDLIYKVNRAMLYESEYAKRYALYAIQEGLVGEYKDLDKKEVKDEIKNICPSLFD